MTQETLEFSWARYTHLPEDLDKLQDLKDRVGDLVSGLRSRIEHYSETHPDVAKNYREDLKDREDELTALQEKHARISMLLNLPDLPVGTRVRVIRVDPMFNFACSPYPANGETGIIRERGSAGLSRQVIEFTGVMACSDGATFEIETEEDPDPICLFLPKDCFEAVE